MPHQVPAWRSAVSPDEHFDVVISSPPSFAGEPLNVADRAWYAGPNYSAITPCSNERGRG